MLRRLVLVVSLSPCSFLWAQDEQAKAPSIVLPRVSALFPLAAGPGECIRVELRGEFLDRASAIRFETKEVSGIVLSSTFTRAHLEFTVDPNAAPGPRFFRLVSPRGPSNLMLFRISRWPTPVEAEPNDQLDPPNLTELQVPALLSAALSSFNDVDLFRFHARAGQRIQFNLLGARNWTSADASLAILYPDGREIVHDEGRFIWDPYIDHTFQQEGDYLAAVTVTRMPAGGQGRNDLNYLLAVGQAPFIWSIFPMGSTRGEKTEVHLRADFLSETTVRVDLEHPGIQEIRVEESSGTLVPPKFIVGELPEAFETEPNNRTEEAQNLSLPLTVNGRINENGDQDWYRISVQAAQSLTFAIDAEKYGSFLDSHLAILDKSGNIVAESDDAKWLGRDLNRDSLLTHAFEQAGEYVIRVSDVYRLGSPDHVYRLTVRPSRPHFQLSLRNDRAAVATAGSGRLGVNVLRQEGFKGTVTVEVTGLPAGLNAEPLTIAEDKDSGTLLLKATEPAPIPPAEIQVFGRALVDGQEIRIQADLPEPRFQGSGPGFIDSQPVNALVSIAEPPCFSLESLANTVYLVRGGNAEFGVRVNRRPGFDLPLDITMENLPRGVSIENVEFIDQGRMARIRLTADETAPQTRVSDLVIIGTASKDVLKTSEPAPKISLQVD